MRRKECARGSCVCVCVCVTLMDAPMERRTDAWADLTACSGGAPHTFAARLGRKHLRSAETNRSPKPFAEPRERRRNELPRGSSRGGTRKEILRSSDSQRIRRKEPFLRLLTSVRVEGKQHHIWRTRRRSENGGFGELTFIALHGCLARFSFVHTTTSA